MKGSTVRGAEPIRGQCLKTIRQGKTVPLWNPAESTRLTPPSTLCLLAADHDKKKGVAMNMDGIESSDVTGETGVSPALAATLTPRKLLKKLSGTWGRRAQVKKDDLQIDMLFDEGKEDFRIDLLPFKDHPAFLKAPERMQKKALSCGWLAYNEKTVEIETKIVTPACVPIIYGEVPGVQDEVSKQIASQTLVDEAYHVLLVNNANRITREQRDLLSIKVPECTLITKMREAQEQYREQWQKILVQLVTAIVSEVFISDYLKILSGDMSIQALNRVTVDVHRRDELAHSGIFKNLAKCVYAHLSKREREFVLDVLPKPVRWFASLELDVWQSLLQQIHFPAVETIVNDCRSVNAENLQRLDYTGILSLAAELGAFDSQQGVESFYREGLIT
jgi:hypothetical protein